MTNKAPLEVELPSELIQHYKKAFAALSDMRLLILLLFNSFEEIMKSFAAWRLSCRIDELPKFIKVSPHSLFEVVLIGPSAKDLRKHTKEFSELRNAVAHNFHLNDYEEGLKMFIENVSKRPCPYSEEEKRKRLTEAVSLLALNIASCIDEIQPRGQLPLPFLSLELNS
jgi:hypothetical protein